MDFDVVIIGFGLVGSSIAYHLNKSSSQKIAIIEQAFDYIPTKSSIGGSRIGGRSIGSECREYYEMLPFSNNEYRELAKYNPKIHKPNNGIVVGQDSQLLKDIISSSIENNVEVDIIEGKQQKIIDPYFRQFQSLEKAIIEKNNSQNMLGILNPSEIIKTYYNLLKDDVEFFWDHKFIEYKRNEESIELSTINSNAKKTIRAKKLIYATNANSDILQQYNLTLSRQRIPVFYYEVKNSNLNNTYIEVVNNHFEMYAMPEVIEGKYYIKTGLHNCHLYDDMGLTDQEFADKISRILTEKIKKNFPGLNSDFNPMLSMCEYGLTKDGLPLVGKIDDDIWVAVGFNGHGCKHAPAFGKMVSDSVLNIEDRKLYNVFDPLRFHSSIKS
ncbi:FAD-dependent oxidoreductase [Francisella sp. 19X1-34]|uniref:NAD(P)/FAD-dependent oxidoreductase n=1 Tax=Francisella sp. 19X1-34 TaxID=3087177 RepID=UPI002E30B5E4|nr:FAD-dependent oxidoreductase [Francisella sp. 19X1-34]MED7787873.1 FAD-dependent oxidoreductase [Francisella sp. 19X1-34]